MEPKSKFVLRVGKLKNQLAMRSSAQHIFRESVSDNVDLSRSHLNYKIVDSVNSAHFLENVETVINSENVKKDAKSTKLMEIVISASPAQLSLESFDQRQYFEDCVNWVKRKHGSESVISAVVHMDEDTPHLHIHAVPLNQIEATNRKRSVSVKGGGREVREFTVEAHTLLSANVVYGGPGKISALQTDFEQTVGINHGLHRDKRYIGVPLGEGYESPRQYKARLDDRAELLEIRESDVVMNFAKIDRFWEMHQKELKQLEDEKTRLESLSDELTPQKAKLDDLAATLAGERRRLDQDQEKLVQGEKDLAKMKSELITREAALNKDLSDLQRRTVELDQREEAHKVTVKAELTDIAESSEALDRRWEKYEADVAALASREETHKANISRFVPAVEAFKRDKAAFAVLVQGHHPDQIAGALAVVEATKKKGIDMDHLTNGDCVIILGKTWAIKNNITTAEDMMRPADPETAAWARRVGLPKPKPDPTQSKKM